MKQSSSNATLAQFLDQLNNLKSNLNATFRAENLTAEINNLLIQDPASFDSSRIANLLNYLSDLGLKKNDLSKLNLGNLLTKLDATVATASGWNLTRIMNGFARLGYEKDEINLSDDFFTRLNKTHVSKSTLPVALHGMSFLGYKSDNVSGNAQDYLQKLVKRCTKTFPTMNARAKATFIHSLARMEMTDVLMNMKDQLNEKVGESLSELSSDSAYSILQSYMFCDLIEEDALLENGLCQNLAQIARPSAETHYSSLQKQVRQNLTASARFQEEYPLYEVYGTTIRPLDFLITNGETLTGLEVDGPPHFLLNNNPSIKTQQRDYINLLAMKRSGLQGRYVVIDHFSLTNHKRDLKNYLANLLVEPQLKSGVSEITDLKDIEINVPDEVKEEATKTRETIEEFFVRIKAASNHNEVKSLISKLNKSGRLNETDNQGNNLVHLCAKDDDKILPILLNRNIDINLQNHEGKTPLHLAAEFGNPSNLKELLSLGADFSAIDSSGKSTIDLAFEAASKNPESKEHSEILDTLLKYVEPAKLQSLIAQTELSEAIKIKLKRTNQLFSILASGNISMISRMVLRRDFNFDLESVKDSMLRQGILNKLIDYKLSETGRNSETGEAALIIFEEFCSRGIAVDQETKSKLTTMIKTSLTELFDKITRIDELPPIIIKDFPTYVNCVAKLLENGNQDAICKIVEIASRSFNKKENRSFNESLINECAEKGFEDVVKKLHQLNPSLISIPFPLYSAARNGDLSMVDTLINLGCDVNQTSSNHKTSSLQIAIRNGYTEVAKLLIEKGANVGHTSKVNASNYSEDTLPIVLAVSATLPQITKIILDNKKFKMPEKIRDKLAKGVVARRDFDNLDLLMQYGEIDINKVYPIPTADGRAVNMTLLMLAAKANDAEMAEVLINHGAQVEKMVQYDRDHNINSIHLCQIDSPMWDLLMSKATLQQMEKMSLPTPGTLPAPNKKRSQLKTFNNERK